MILQKGRCRMAKLLYIKASPRAESFSARVADAFIEKLGQVHEGWEVETLDLFHADLPPFDTPAAKAKYAVLSGGEPSGPDQVAWTKIIEIIDHFKSADAYVIASPMWNFGIPYRLKQYIDILLQPALTFSYSPEEGYRGLVTGRPVLLALARGGEYTSPDVQPLDMQKPYLETILGFIGLTDVHSIVVQPTLQGGPETAEQALAAAADEARNIVGRWPAPQPA